MSIRKRTWSSGGVERTAWVVDYFDQAGKRRLKTFDTKKAADAWAVTARHEVSQGTHTPASASVTVTEATERWIADCEANGLEFGTIKQRKEHLRLHIAPFLGREKLSSLTAPRVHQFVADMRKAGRSLAMRRKVLTNVKSMLSFAQGQGLVAQNVARGVKIKSDERATATGPLRAGVDFPTRAELRTIMDTATGRWRSLVIAAVFTGMRASELRGLTWDNVDLDEGVIHVRQRADAWSKIANPKSKAGKRDIPLAPMVVNTLKEWRASCPAGALGLVFPNTLGNVESQANVLSRFWFPLQVQAGLITEKGEPKYTFHSLRHAAASLFIAHLGWTPKRVQSVMGHASVTMTFDRYGHLFEDREGDREAMKKLEAAIVAA
jgi:integrase